MKKYIIIACFVILIAGLLTSLHFLGQDVIKNQSAATVNAVTSTMSKAQAESEVRSIYSVCLGRTPDSGGLKNYTEKLMNGESVNKVKSDICNSPEAQKYSSKTVVSGNGSKGSGTNSSYEQQVAAVYRICLKREPDAGGLKTYTDMLKKGKSINDVTSAVCNSPEAAKVGTSQYDLNAVKNLFKDGGESGISKDNLFKIGLVSALPGSTVVAAVNTPISIVVGSAYVLKKVFGW